MYVDTSTIGGYHDEIFKRACRRFFHAVRKGRIIILVSDFVYDELNAGAPRRVHAVLEKTRARYIERVDANDEVETLRNAYLDAGIVGPASKYDAAHVAAAAVARADAIVSCNMTQIVHKDKIAMYNRINLLRGYGELMILKPEEVFEHD